MDEQRDPRDRLPPEIYDFAIIAGSDAGRSVASISLRQTGRMRQDRDTRWMSFRATETISAKTGAFEGKARVGPGGLVVVRDTLRGVASAGLWIKWTTKIAMNPFGWWHVQYSYGNE